MKNPEQAGAPKESKESRYRSFKVRAGKDELGAAPTGDKVRFTPLAAVRPGGSRAASAVETTDVPSDAIARVTLDNGFELWVRADDLMQEAGVKAEARSDGEVLWDIGDLNAGATTSRGLGSALGLATRVIEFFGIDLKKEAHEFAARRLGAHFERKILGRDPGLYSCAIGTMTLGAKLDAVAAPDKPLLLFIHGTASSFDGSFGKLGADEKAAGSAACDRLHGVYGDRVYAFEHRSLTVSPIQNALELAEALPQHAELHLVSHSRGGLVGELLCLGQRVRTSDPLRAEVLKRLFVGDVAIAQQLNIEPLDEEGRKRLQDDYAADRDNLLKLSALLDMKQFRITRFVRVACPAMGTTLASGRLDRWFSLLLNAGRIAGLQHVPLVPEALDFIAAVLRERTDPRVLPGLEAMMPGSAVVRLLNHPETQTTADLTVIAGDIEGGHSFLSSLKVFVTDWFYKGEHDLVVNTGSMFGGIKRPERGARQQMDKGDAVNHFSYFHNPRTVDWLLQGLTRADGSDAGFRPISERPPTPPAWRSAIARSHAGGLPKPLAVVLPGTMGSSLKANGDRVWLDYRTLAFGGLEKIGIDAAQIEVDGLVDAFYAPLLVHLAQTHRVEFFAYDWRNSVQAAAQQLADQLSMWLPALQAQGQPVHIVAHSMGGLVVRAMMADRKGAEVWQRICELPNSRLLMLGTPNHGSHEAVRWLSGRNPTQFKLMLLDLMNSRDGIIDIVRRYPGLVELLPFPADASAVRYDEPALWSELRDALGESWKPADATVLRNARRTWDKLNGAIDAQRMIYVAGVQPQTVCGHALIQDDGAFRFNRRKLVFEQTPEGDGTVTWASGRLPGVPMYFAKGTSHDELCSRDFGRQTFAGYTDLLLKGTTTRLAREMDVSRGMRSAATPAASHSTSPPPFDSVPSAADIERLTFGPGNPAPPEADTLPGLEVQLTHGDLCYVKHPLMVGHYLGDSIVSAEKALDGQLMHARERIGPLTQRMDLGLYPGPIGSSAVFYNESSQARPIAAIIVGLGELGSLSPGRLESTVSEALLTYCFELAQMPEHKSPIKRADMRSMGLSSVLIGSGAGGMNLRDSIEALLRAVVNTNRRLMDARLADRVYISKLQLIELYQDVAINAADALEDVMASVDFRADVRWPDQTVHAGDGGCRRVSFENRDDWWHRLEISTDPDDSRLRFVSSTNRARAEETIGLGQLSLAGQFIERACAQPGRNREAARTLFDMLLPNRLKELAPDNNNLLLVLDEKSAAYPWELLEDRWATSPLPPAARSGLLRSLKTSEFRAQPVHGTELSALVIGHPDLEGWDRFIDLPGARDEAQHVADCLNQLGYQTTACIDAPHTDILESLHKQRWRILHLAGHGEHDYIVDENRPHDCGSCGQPVPIRRKPLSGMVIGRDVLLTPGDVEQMRYVPELVFINCCHLGKTRSQHRHAFPALAANLGVQFIRMGVKAVVAAGWAVDDAAAKTFAGTFYQAMLSGQTFGDAVRAARRACVLQHPQSNTFGAYQCYGDPGFRLLRSQADGSHSTARPAGPLHSHAELVSHLDNQREWVRMQSADLDGAWLQGKVDGLLDRIPDACRDKWLRRADVRAALGFLWGEVGDYARAIDHLDAALSAYKGDCPIRVVEQCANFRVRLAGRRWSEALARGKPDDALRDQLRDAIIAAIMELDLLIRRAKTPERLNMMGAACKRLALVTSGQERQESLVNMASYYRDALEMDERGAAYPFTNSALADLFAAAGDPGYAPLWARDTLLSEAERIRSACEAESLDDPGLWLATGTADCMLLTLIAEALSAPQGKSEQAGTRRGRPSAKRTGKASDTAAETLAAKLDPIRSAYVNAFRRGASPRERASIVENFDFLIALLDGFDTAGDGRHAEAHGLRPLVSALIVLREHVQERS
jgi:hypothetical protein